MELYEFGTGSTDRQRLAHCIDTLNVFLDEILRENRERQYFIPGFEEAYLSAWEELQLHFLESKETILKDRNIKLYDHGLYGRQLDFKFAVINHFSRLFFEAASNTREPSKRVNGILKKLLETIDKLLRSIFDAIGAGGAIGEFKDFLETLVDDEDVQSPA